jgi:hypothetical protein
LTALRDHKEGGTMKKVIFLLIILIILILSIVGKRCFGVKKETAVDKQDMALNEKRHYEHPWKVHEIAKDFKLLDVWEYPILADKSKNQDFLSFRNMLKEKWKPHLKNIVSVRFVFAGALFGVRMLLGKIFSLDKNENALPIPGCKETSLKERLSMEDREKNLAEQKKGGNNKSTGFRTVYVYENEFLWEFSNKTVHALMHTGWIHKYDNYYTAQLAVYAKTRGRLGDLYMKLIMPFRRCVIYPVLMENIKIRWEKYCER